MTNYQTPLKRARGLGASRGGTSHFWWQRVTAVSNILVTLFLVYAAIRLAGAPWQEVKAFFSEPLHAIFGVLLAISMSFHMRLGMQVIIEDYIHHEPSKVMALMLNSFFAVLIGVAATLAVAKLYLGA